MAPAPPPLVSPHAEGRCRGQPDGRRHSCLTVVGRVSVRNLGPRSPARSWPRPRGLRADRPRRLRRVNTDQLADAITARLPEVRLLTDPLDRESHRYDETAYNKAGLPGAVVFPTATEQVAELVRIAAEMRVPVVARGAGTGLSGGAAGIEGCLTIVFTKMDRILEIDKENLVAVVQPGV